METTEIVSVNERTEFYKRSAESLFIKTCKKHDNKLIRRQILKI